MVMEMFGINDMLRKNIDQSNEVNLMFYNQETTDIDNAIKTLERIQKQKS